MTSIVLSNEGADDPRRSEELEHLIWNPSHGLGDTEIDQFQIIARYDDIRYCIQDLSLS